MNKINDDLKEIEKFLSEISFSAHGLASEAGLPVFKASYKQFHALLVWGLIAEAQPASSRLFKTYFREALSDISHAYALTLFNLYKPARMSLRSGIENVVRSILLLQGVKADEIATVYGLFDRIKLYFSGDATISARIHKLAASYADLCKTAHSAKTDYMSLTVPFNNIIKFQNAKFNSNLGQIRDVSATVNQNLFWIWHLELRLVGHTNSDLVRDAVPRTLKRAATATLL